MFSQITSLGQSTSGKRCQGGPAMGRGIISSPIQPSEAKWRAEFRVMLQDIGVHMWVRRASFEHRQRFAGRWFPKGCKDALPFVSELCPPTSGGPIRLPWQLSYQCQAFWPLLCADAVIGLMGMLMKKQSFPWNLWRASWSWKDTQDVSMQKHAFGCHL